MHIELAWLEQLLAFADCGTLSAAAEQLLFSQPALSQSMKKLEEAIGVSLFKRTKNRMTLNENGKQAVIYAKRLLEQEKNMIERLRLFDHSNHTISLGVCAPVPLWNIVPLLSQYFSGMCISSEMKNRDEDLLEGLEKGTYQIVVVHTKPNAEGVFFMPYRKERLSFFVPWNHPLAQRDFLWLADIDRQNLLLYTDIGFWYKLCREKLPNAHFLMMNEREVFEEIAEMGAFPSFGTDAIARKETKNRKEVPILDDAMCVTYYCVCREAEKKRFAPFFSLLQERFAQKEVCFGEE